MRDDGGVAEIIVLGTMVGFLIFGIAFAALRPLNEEYTCIYKEEIYMPPEQVSQVEDKVVNNSAFMVYLLTFTDKDGYIVYAETRSTWVYNRIAEGQSISKGKFEKLFRGANNGK